MRDFLYRARYRGPILRLAGRGVLLRRSDVEGMVRVQFNSVPKDWENYPDNYPYECLGWHDMPACDFVGRSMIAPRRRLRRLGLEDNR